MKTKKDEIILFVLVMKKQRMCVMIWEGNEKKGKGRLCVCVCVRACVCVCVRDRCRESVMTTIIIK